MPNLEKAKIYEISSGNNPSTQDDGVDVQFNPESLSVSFSNRVEGGRSTGRQVRQFVGSSSNTFSLDLEFDTADEGTAEGEPISVLERTSVLDKFIQPKRVRGQPRQQPAKFRFHWADLIIDGIVESIDLELDHFAHNGYPLHAKVTLKLKEQKIEYQFTERDAETETAEDRVQVAQALDNELPSQAASRLGMDPENWRDLDFDIASGLSLEAGLELNFQAEFSASLGVDIKAGINADIDLGLSASLGLDVGASVSQSHLANDSRPKQELSAGLALAKAGGIVAATNQVTKQQVETASSESVSSFALDSVIDDSATSALNASVSRIDTDRNRRRPSTAPDSRATTFGYSVPLQNRRVPILEQQRAIRASSRSIDLGSSSNSGRVAADLTQARRRPHKRCGCQHPCKH